MKTLLLLPLFFGISLQSISQNQEQYSILVKEAWSLYESKDYEQSATKYKAAFDQLDGKAYSTDRYNAACAYALANYVENSFYHLFYLAENPKIKYRNLNHIKVDSDLNLLHQDERWEKLIKLVSANKADYEKDLDKPLVAILDTVYQEDQKYRKQLNEIAEKHGWQSDEMKAHWKIINEKDSINLIKVKKILDERGWLGAKVIGDQGNSALFLVIQHADLETQIAYLPMMREAVKEGNAAGSSLALLEDRVALRQGKKQIYGSQVMRDNKSGKYHVSPIEDAENVNERRASVGLGPIEDYVSRWDIEWDAEKHNARVAGMEAEKQEKK